MEKEGFEPSLTGAKTIFEIVTIDHSAISPKDPRKNIFFDTMERKDTLYGRKSKKTLF